MPEVYDKYVQEKPKPNENNLLAYIKDYRSLMPIAQEATKPIFLLKPGDGAIGSHYQAVQSCYKDFEELSQLMLSKIKKLERV